MIDVKVGDIVTTKKPHACGNSRWEIVRVGADYKFKCLHCGKIVMLDSVKAQKAIVKVENGQEK